MRYSITLLCLIALCGCGDSKDAALTAVIRHDTVKTQGPVKAVPENTQAGYTSMKEVVSGHRHWTSNHAEGSGYMCSIVFEEEYAVYRYHGQCIYDYFTHTYWTGANKIELLWLYKSDCLLDMDFLEKPNGVKKYPHKGDVFATYTLKNDTTLQAAYNFPEWAKKVNAMERDSLFPVFFYLERNDD